MEPNGDHMEKKCPCLDHFQQSALFSNSSFQGCQCWSIIHTYFQWTHFPEKNFNSHDFMSNEFVNLTILQWFFFSQITNADEHRFYGPNYG